MEKINWGIIGTGNIAHSVLPALQSLEKANVVACAARKIEKAHEFAAEFKINRAYGSYDELLSDADVQIVYIATPHMNHFELSKKALEAGKAVVIAVNKWDLIEDKDEAIKKWKQNIEANFMFMSYAKVVFLSAKTKKRIHTLMPEILKVYENSKKEIKTSILMVFGI